MKKSTATSTVTNTIIRIAGLALMALAFMVMTAQVAKGEEPREKPQYAEWVVSYNDAVQQSKKTGRPIMLVFSGSDWCNWCTKLMDEVFTTREFARWSTDSVIKVEVDFPQMYDLPSELQVQNDTLKEQFGHHVQSYPTVLFVNARGDLLGKTGYVHGGATIWVENAKHVVDHSTTQNRELLAQSNN